MTFQEMSALMDTALGTMRDKHVALEAAQQHQRAVIDEAQAATAAALRDYETAVGEAQALRRQIDTALTEIPAASAPGVVVS